MTVGEAKAFLKMAGWIFEPKKGGFVDAKHPEKCPHGYWPHRGYWLQRGYKGACTYILRYYYQQPVSFDV